MESKLPKRLLNRKSRHYRIKKVFYLRDLLKKEMLEEIARLRLPPLMESQRKNLGGFSA